MKTKVRYAVMGLGHIAQTAVLPAFAHARGSSTVTALISSDATKLRKLGRRYGVDGLYSYEQFDECMESGEIDALYMALPNHLHAEYTIRAARHGVHVLCEKPMAVTETDAEAMIRACESNGVRLMIAYRLHFEKANLAAMELVRVGQDRRAARTSTRCSRWRCARAISGCARRRAAGPLYDIGIYCINAARVSVPRRADRGPRRERAARHGALRRGARRCSARRCGSRTTASPISSAASARADCAEYRVVGTKGHVRLEPAYEYAMELKQYVTTGDKPRERVFAKRDQFAPELAYFSDCIQRGAEPEPSGWEGLADVRIIEALYRSAEKRKPIALAPFEKTRRPSESQEIHRPPVNRPPKAVKSTPPSRG